MNQLFLLKMIAELLDGTPTADKIDCARKILKGMIEEYEPKSSHNVGMGILEDSSPLDPEARQAQQELMQ